MTASDGEVDQRFQNVAHVALALFVGSIGMWIGERFKLTSVEACHENRWADVEEVA